MLPSLITLGVVVLAATLAGGSVWKKHKRGGCCCGNCAGCGCCCGERKKA